MLKILRLNADIRYCDVLKKKKQNEAQEIVYEVIKTTTINVPLRSNLNKEEKEQPYMEAEVDGELIENEIVY